MALSLPPWQMSRSGSDVWGNCHLFHSFKLKIWGTRFWQPFSFSTIILNKFSDPQSSWKQVLSFIYLSFCRHTLSFCGWDVHTYFSHSRRYVWRAWEGVADIGVGEEANIFFIGTFWGWGDGSSRGEQYERCNQREGGGGEVIVRIFLTNSRLLVDATWKHSATYYSMLECFYFCPELPLGNHSAQCTSFWLGFWPPLDFSHKNNNFPLNKKKIDIFSQSFKSSSTILLPGTSPVIAHKIQIVCNNFLFIYQQEFST